MTALNIRGVGSILCWWWLGGEGTGQERGVGGRREGERMGNGKKKKR
jgi:hypothetical protein